MDKNMKKAVLKNRVKLLALDYFDLTAPLLASEILPSKKHKEIKTQATDSKARVDLLLEWLEESAPKDAFPIFLNGIRNCKELILAKKIKREASGKETGPASEGKAKPSGSTIPLDQLLAEIIPSLPATLPVVAASASTKAKKPKASKPKTNLAPPPVPINGLPSTNLLLPPPPPVAKKRKAEGDAKQPKVKLPKPKPAASGAPPVATAAAAKSATPKTPKAKGAAGNKQNGTPRSDSRSGTPKSSAAAIAAAAAAAAAKAAAAMAAAATPRATRKSSSSDTVQGKGTPKGKAATKTAAPKKGKQEKKDAAAGAGSAAGGTSPKRNAATKANPMTFKEVEEKQVDFKNKFRFTNANAVAKVIHFKDKSDITYLGCPFLVNNKMCGKRVELKSKEFICEAKQKSPNCRQIPRLLVTCSDGTADLVLTLMKQNVEIFSSKSESDIETMTVDEIKVVLEKAVGRKLNVDVTSEKAKKGAKKGAAVKWNNVATLIDESDEPPNKKKRTK